MKLVWDASALVAVIRVSDAHHEAAYGLWLEHQRSRILIPALAWFEYQASVNRLMREGTRASSLVYLREGVTEILPIDDRFIQMCSRQKLVERFNTLRGADLVYACAAALERATLVTFDAKLKEAFGRNTLP
jgi:predicted nucleic acid-binding protein